MTYDFFTIVDTTDDDSSLYPVLSEPGCQYSVATSPLDGRIEHLTATGVVVYESTPDGLSPALQAPEDLKWDVLITDSRVVVYCVKFDKGGGWGGWGLGGLAVAATANAVSTARAARRHKGKILVGHLRYPWLQTLLAANRQGWGTHETVRMQVDSSPRGDRRPLIVELRLPKQVDAAVVGQEIAARAALYRLRHDVEMGVEERAAFDAIADGPRKQPQRSDPKQPPKVRYDLPTNFRVNSSTAFPVGSPEAPGTQGGTTP